jgi:GNAT superfamily N-acetyltransferase
MLRIQTVETAGDRRTFVRLARDLYPPGSPWVRPLDRTVLDSLHPTRNPFYRDGVGRAFLARRDGRLVGRVLAHVWRRHQRLHGECVGYFGLFECADDAEAAAALLGQAAEVARAEGCRLLRGPFNMTAAQEIGTLTAGHDRPPAIDMVYTPPWHPALLESAGFRPCLHMQTWRNEDIRALRVEEVLPPPRRAALQAAGVTARPLRARHKDEDMELVRELINAAFLGNWCFVPITRAEWEFQVGPLLPLLDGELVLLAEAHGVPVGTCFAVPDFNQLLRRLNGSLLAPAALFTLLRRRPADDALIVLIAVRKQYQGLGVIRLLNAELVRALQRRGYRGLGCTWVAADNGPSRAQMGPLGMRPWHDLAMYEREI